MKKLNSIIVFLFVAQLASGQDFLSESKQWNVRNYFWGDIRTEIYWINGDSSMDGTMYKKLWYSMDSLRQQEYLQALIRQKGDRVYYKPFVAAEGLLYDFGLQAGESAEIISLWCAEPIERTVSLVDTVNYFGQERRRWHFEGTEEYWIEGIGSNSGLIHAFYMDCVFDIGYDLLCYYNEEELLYIKENEADCFQTSVGITHKEAKEGIHIFPNPASEYVLLQSEMKLNKAGVQILDVHGKVVLRGQLNSNSKKIIIDELSPGVYLIQFEQPGIPVLKFLKY